MCLTVTEFDAHAGWFKVEVAPETLLRTNLGEVHVGDALNCERAMAAHTRFGGHFVQGHVDTKATLVSKEPTGPALTLTLRLVYEAPDAQRTTLPLPSSLSPYLVPKGYVTLDGASLTLIEVSPLHGGHVGGGSSAAAAGAPANEVIEFTVMLIPHTQEHIGLPSKPVGALVNVEFDMVGKYVYRSIAGELERLSDAETPTGGASLTPAMLDRLVSGSVQRVLRHNT